MTAEHAKLLLDENKSLEEKQQRFAALLVAHDEALTELLETLPKLREQVKDEALAGVVPEVEKRGADTVQAALPTLAEDVRGKLLIELDAKHAATCERLEKIREEVVAMAAAEVQAVKAAGAQTTEQITAHISRVLETAGEVERGLVARIEAEVAKLAEAKPPAETEPAAKPDFNLADYYKGQITPGETLLRGSLYTWIGSTYLVLEDTTETPNRSNVRGKGAKFALIAARGAAGSGGGEGGGGAAALPFEDGRAGIVNDPGAATGRFLRDDNTFQAIPGGGDMLAANSLSDVDSVSDARDNLGLGTAATTDAADYATAAQGATADSALQPAGDGSQLTGLTKAQVGLGNVTNDAQTKASVVPNAVVTAGILVGQSGTAYASVTMSGDATIATNGVLTFATANANVGMFGSATATPAITFDAKGRATGVVTVLITPAIANVTGLGTSVSAALAVNGGSAGAVVTIGGPLGTPASGVGTNLTGIPIGSLVAGTLAANMTLGEGAGQIALDAALSADGTFSGIIEAVTAGATVTFGNLLYKAVADSRWELTDADAEATAGPVQLGICVSPTAADGVAMNVLLWGKVRADAMFPTLTVGPVYVSTTAGAVQTTQPSGTDDVMRVIGFGLDADTLFFNPSNDYATHI